MDARLDVRPDLSINALKAARYKLKKRIKDPTLRAKTLKDITRLIQIKQALYFHKYQFICGVGRWRNPKRYPQRTFKWGQKV